MNELTPEARELLDAYLKEHEAAFRKREEAREGSDDD